jgi:hypothetical protein
MHNQTLEKSYHCRSTSEDDILYKVCFMVSRSHPGTNLHEFGFSAGVTLDRLAKTKTLIVMSDDV